MDQAFQFVVSCGVVVPIQQLVKLTEDEQAAQALLTASENGESEEVSPGLRATTEEGPQP